MNAPVPSRLLLQSLQLRPKPCTHYLVPLSQQHRSLFGRGRGKTQQRLDATQIEKLAKEVDASKKKDMPRPNSGQLTNSIFDTLPKTPQTAQERQTREQSKEQESASEMEEEEEEDWQEAEEDEGPKAPIRLEDLKPTFRNPRPAALVRWERKMAIRNVQGRHRLSKTDKIMRTERVFHAKSPFVKTSTKKMGGLARQIAGKPLDEAMIQMRFSRKKAAQDVLKHLKMARDQAVVSKEMGLGRGVGKGVDRPPPKGLEAELEKNGKVLVEDRDGKKRVVTDRSAIYVDEAWVGKGVYDTDVDRRARGRAHRIIKPYTSISVVLKEEATRMRMQDDREQKRRQKPVWVQLPDRSITAQRQYPLW